MLENKILHLNKRSDENKVHSTQEGFYNIERKIVDILFAFHKDMKGGTDLGIISYDEAKHKDNLLRFLGVIFFI